MLALSFALLTACSTTSVLVIPANQSVEIDYNNYQLYDAEIQNKSTKGVDVAVLNKVSNEQIRGFGLGIKSKETVRVEQENKLVLTNATNKTLKVKVNANVITTAMPTTNENTAPNANSSERLANKGSVNLTLINTSIQSIPLIIPSVMNPNLLPFSKSGVTLRIGQEIFFQKKGKKYLLLIVDESLKEGDTLNIAELITARKKVLGL